MDGCVEGFGIGESHVGEVIGLKVMPDRLDVIEFGRIAPGPVARRCTPSGAPRFASFIARTIFAGKC